MFWFWNVSALGLLVFQSYRCGGLYWLICNCFTADDIFESIGDRELRQVFEGQNRIHLEIKQLNRQLDMILDEQRRYVSSLTEEISRRGTGTPGQPGQVNFPTQHPSQRQNSAVLTWPMGAKLLHLASLQVSQQELDTVVKTQQEILRQVNEMK